MASQNTKTSLFASVAVFQVAHVAVLRSRNRSRVYDVGHVPSRLLGLYIDRIIPKNSLYLITRSRYAN